MNLTAHTDQSCDIFFFKEHAVQKSLAASLQ